MEVIPPRVSSDAQLPAINDSDSFLPARRYASAGLCDSNVSVCLSRAGIVYYVCFYYCILILYCSSVYTYCYRGNAVCHCFYLSSSSKIHDSSFLMPNFNTKFERGHPERRRQTRDGWVKSAVFTRATLASRFLHRLVTPWFQFSGTKFHHKIRKGSPLAGASNKGGVCKVSSFLSLSLNIYRKR